MPDEHSRLDPEKNAPLGMRPVSNADGTVVGFAPQIPISEARPREPIMYLGNVDRLRFDEAFSHARVAGADLFRWRGGEYPTRTKEEDTKPTPVSDAAVPVLAQLDALADELVGKYALPEQALLVRQARDLVEILSRELDRAAPVKGA